MNLQTTLAMILTPTVLALIGAVLLSFLNSPLVKAAISSFTTKLDNEVALGESTLLHSNNAMLREMVTVAMAFAEQHGPGILVAFKSKADFVEKAVLNDPRFAQLEVPADSIKLIIEDVFQSVYNTAASGTPVTAVAVATAPASIASA